MLFLGVACVSAAGLAFQIALTRVLAITQGYGSLAISLALLGLGASGTVLALFPLSRRTGEGTGVEVILARLALCFRFRWARVISW